MLKQSSKEIRVNLKQQRPFVMLFTGHSGSGKSSISNAVELELLKIKKHTYLLDGDDIRNGLNKDLQFTKKCRSENARRITQVSKLFIDSGLIVLAAIVSPFREDRKLTRDAFQKGDFIEIFIDVPIKICESRDHKGLYKKARQGDILNFTGIGQVYDSPKIPEIRIKNYDTSLKDSVQQVINYLYRNNYI